MQVSVAILLLVVVSLTATPLPGKQVNTSSPALDVGQSNQYVGEATAALLEASTRRPCCLILIADSEKAASMDSRSVREAWRGQYGEAVFDMVAGTHDINVTRRLSQLVPMARQVRQLSSCTMVVVVSHDVTFLAAFAEWSLRGRLLVWASKLVVVTRLRLAQLKALVPTSWVFSMMNAVFLKINKTSSRSRCQVLDHQPYSSGGPQTVQVATCTPSGGLVVKGEYSLFREKFSDFYGAELNVTALSYPPSWEERKGSDNVTVLSGADYYTLEAIAAAYNFTFRVLPTSTWAEVTRLVEERVSFVAPVMHLIIPDRVARYDFSFTYEVLSSGFSMAPPTLKPRWQAFYHPLSGGVWALMLLALFLAPVAFVVITVRVPGEGSGKLDVGEVFQNMMGMLLGQSLLHRLPDTSSSRVLVAAWLMFAVILGSAYSGNLTAFLTLPKYPHRPETLTELVDAVDRITMEPYGEEFVKFFAKSDSPVFQKLARMIHYVPSVVEGQRQAVRRNQAHMEHMRTQRHAIAKWFTRPDGRQLLYIGREAIMPGRSAWPLPHDAPYGADIDRRLMAVVEMGLYDKWVADMLFRVQMESCRSERGEKQSDTVKVSHGPHGLSMKHMKGAFMVLLIGFVISSFAFALESLSSFVCSHRPFSS